jgi:hypothetical protein
MARSGVELSETADGSGTTITKPTKITKTYGVFVIFATFVMTS